MRERETAGKTPVTRVQLLRGRVNTYTWRVKCDGDRTGSPLFFPCDTENAGLVAIEDKERRAWRFRVLSFGRRGDDARSIVDMELIWVVTFVGCGKSPEGLIGSLSGLTPWYSVFEEIAFETGVDYRVEAYLSGVPLEYVLSDVHFDSGRLVLDFPWSDDLRRH